MAGRGTRGKIAPHKNVLTDTSELKHARTKLTGGYGVDNPVTLDDVFAELPTGEDIGPNWIEPRAFYVQEAAQFNPEMAKGYLKTIPSIGENTAVQIVQELGEDCIHLIDKNPSLLREVAENNASVSNKQIEDLISNWEKLREERGPLVQLDTAASLALVEKPLDGKFQEHRRWYLGSKSLIVSPNDTCPQMIEAGANLAINIIQGHKVAVFCDYDVDGTTSGEIFRRGVDDYLKDPDQLHYGYADAKTGFGVTKEFVREAADQGCKVLVTLDCGSSQVEEIELAQELGMRVIVADHHDADRAEGNPADFHLNPQIYDPPASEHTGAQLSWKLTAAVQIAVDGEISEKHWEEPLKLAGIGCYADGGSTSLPENRAFFWAAADKTPIGIRVLSDLVNQRNRSENTPFGYLDEDQEKEVSSITENTQYENPSFLYDYDGEVSNSVDTGRPERPEFPGAMISTQAIMNSPKRSTLVPAEKIGKLLAAKTEEEALEVAKDLESFYAETMKPTKDKMIEEALAQVPEAKREDNGETTRGLKEDQRVATAIIKDYPEFSGNSGLIADKISRHSQTAGVAFVKMDSNDAHGKPLYKFSSRNNAYVSMKLGDMIGRDDINEACKIDVLDQDGNVQTVSKSGGHAAVFSGTCSEDKIPEAIEAFENLAKKSKSFFPTPYTGPEARLTERQVHPSRLESLEKSAQRFAPFSDRDELIAPKVKSRDDKTSKNKPIAVSVIGTLENIKPDPANEKWLKGTLVMDEGITREIRYPADEKVPKNKAEWVIRTIGQDPPYYLRTYHENPKPLTNRIITDKPVGNFDEIDKRQSRMPEWANSRKKESQVSAYEHRTV